MKLPEFAVTRPVMTLMIFLGILLLGVVSLTLTPIDVMPKMEIPTIGIITQYQGAGAEDVENLVTKIIESRVATVSHINDVISKSEENLSSIILRFEWGTNLDEAANEIRQNIDFAKRHLPEDVENPMLVKFDMSMMPVFMLGITAEESYYELHDIVEEKISDPLMRLPGVAMAVPYGGEQREIKINIDSQSLEAYKLSLDQIIGTLAMENISLSAGNLKLGITDYIIRVPGEYSSIGEIRNTIVGTFQSKPVYLKQIADIEDSFKDIDRRVRLDRKPALLVMIQKQSDANTVDVANGINELLPEIQKNLPPDVEIHTAMDASDFIKRSVYNLTATVAWAILFVILVVIAFLRELRGSFIVGITIPFSLVAAFIFIFLGDYTINVMSLSAIAIAIGMVVDNAIVIYENVHYHRREIGEAPNESAIFGSSEVGLAVTASTATTIAIFIPVIFVPGITGIIFKELALMIIIVLASSLFCALALTPMLSSRLLRKPVAVHNGRARAFLLKSENIFSNLENYYRKILDWALNHRKIVITAGLAVFVTSLFMMRTVGTEFMPSMDRGEFIGTVELPIGTKIEITDEVMKRIEIIVEKKVPERELMFARCGVSESGTGAMMGRRNDTNIITVGGRLVPKKDRDRSDADVGRMLSTEIAAFPEVSSVDFTPQDPIESITSGGADPVSIEIYGNDLDVSLRFARSLKNLVSSVEGMTDVSISMQPGKPELWINVDREKAAGFGLNMHQISNTIRNNFFGKTATLYRDEGEEYDMTVRLKEMQRSDIEDILNTPVASPVTGEKIQLRNFAEIEVQRGPLVYERKNQERVIYVGGGIYERALGDVVNDIKKLLADIKIPKGIEIRFGGSAEDQATSFRYLFVALILGIIFVYMVMAAQFESLIDPFIIMFSVPFAITGVIWALLITGKTLSLVSYVGMIMLVGIVVNNGIVLVDYMNILRARGQQVREAILSASRRRLRPVLMTSLTTIFALFPLAVRRGEGAEMWNPLAIAVIGGLFVSLVITLIFVPTLYSILEERLKGRRIFSKLGGGSK